MNSVLRLALIGMAAASLVAVPPGARGQSLSSASVEASLHGPGNVYGRIPEKDEFGRDQLAMFRLWNPDPIGRHEANLMALNPWLAKVVRKAQADNPDLRFVIGSGRRDPGMQRRAFSWGWSKTPDSAHQSGDAVDLWPLDEEGRVHFDPKAMTKIGAAMRKAARELGVSILWGGHFRGYRDGDRSHFELTAP
jgi:peptidoglycan L-alanyl-D-glutamate endopeptidase CwlK